MNLAALKVKRKYYIWKNTSQRSEHNMQKFRLRLSYTHS